MKMIAIALALSVLAGIVGTAGAMDAKSFFEQQERLRF